MYKRQRFKGLPLEKYNIILQDQFSAKRISKLWKYCEKNIVDPKDKLLVKKIQSLDMKVFETKITMKNKIAEDALANFILKQVHV